MGWQAAWGNSKLAVAPHRCTMLSWAERNSELQTLPKINSCMRVSRPMPWFKYSSLVR
jgi:hypothetical protein